MRKTPVPVAASGSRNPRRWLILAVICLAQLVVLIDNTILNLAIPKLTEDLGATTADIQWMINAYVLVQAGLLLTAGSLGDRYGRKRALLIGLLLFGSGSLAAAFSESSGQLIAARAGMGIGGALLMTTTLAVVMQVFDEDQLPKAIGLWSAVSSLGYVSGSLVGGVLLAHFWWGSIFLINIPAALLGYLAVAKLVPESRNPEGRRPDLLGALLSTIGMVGVVYAIISGPEHGWTSASVLTPAGVGLFALAAFVRWELHVPHPMLDMSFFRSRRFNGAIAGSLLVAFGMGGSIFLLTQHLQLVLGYGPLDAGLRTAPLALVVVLLNLVGVGAKLIATMGTATTITVGMTLNASGLAAVALLGTPDLGYWWMLGGLLIMGCGIALSTPAMANAVMSSIPPAKAGSGAGVQGTVNQFGSGLGVAILGAALNSRFAALLPVGLGAGAAGSLHEALAAAPSPELRAQVHDAFAGGVRTSQLIGALAVFAGGLLAGLLLRRAARSETAAQEAHAAQARSEAEQKTRSAS